MKNESRNNHWESPGAISESHRKFDASSIADARQNTKFNLEFNKLWNRAVIELERSLVIFYLFTKTFFLKTGLPALEESMNFLKVAITAFIESVKSTDHSYHASFEPATAVLSTSNHGFCIGREQISRKDSTRSMLCVSPTGGGKSQVVAIPSLLQAKASFCVSDSSGELFAYTAGDLASRGYKIIRINFSDPSISSFYNPLAHCDVNDCYKIADTLIRTTTPQSSESFWVQSAISLIGLVACALMHGDKRYAHFANVRRVIQLLSTSPQSVDRIIASSGNPQIIIDYKSFLKYEEKVRMNIQASALTALLPFASPSVALVTSNDEIKWQELRARKVAIFLNCFTADSKFLSPLISLFFLQLSRFIMSAIPNSKTDNYIFLILDEFASLHAIPDFGLFISNCRKFLSGAQMHIQSLSQLYSCYSQSEAQTIIANSYSRLYFGGVAHGTATQVAAELGKYEFDSEHGHRVRELLTPDQIRTLPSDKGIFICGNYKPTLLTLTPAYKHPYFKRRMQTPIATSPGIPTNTVIHFTV
ncbi:MAG: recombinase [Bacteroidetes bacterium]|nr:recombinase [Bacteroidota bacterium]